MKKCPQCNLEKSLSEFGRLKSSKDGKRPHCRQCRKKYYLKPLEQVEAWNKRRRERMQIMGSSFKGIIRSEEWRKNLSQSKIKAYIEKGHDYKPTCINRMFNTYKKNGSDIDFEIFKELIFKNCFYCGEPPKNKIYNTSRTAFIETNGIDRMNNFEGYTSDNIVPCCKICNYSKRDMSVENFKNWVYKIYHNWIG